MKTKIKRHSRSVLSVILAISMLISCMMVGLIASDAAKVTDGDEPLGYSGATLYYKKSNSGTWSSASRIGMTMSNNNNTGTQTVTLDASSTYYFVIVADNNDWWGNNLFNLSTTTSVTKTLGSYSNFSSGNNISQNPNTLQTSTSGTYTFTITLSSGSCTVSGGTGSSSCSTNKTYRVVGTAGIAGSAWSSTATANNMTYDASIGCYKKTYSNVAAGTNDFRIIEGSTWSKDWGYLQTNDKVDQSNIVTDFKVKPEPDGDNNIRMTTNAKANVEIRLDDSKSSSTTPKAITVIVTPAIITVNAGDAYVNQSVNNTAGSIKVNDGSSVTNIAQGGTITAKAVADHHWHFVSWREATNLTFANNTKATTTVTVNGSDTVNANFAKDKYTVTKVNGTNSTVSTDKTSVEWGDTVTVTTTPASGYYVTGVTCTYVDGNGVTQNVTVSNPSTNTYTFTMPQYNVTVTSTDDRLANADLTFLPNNVSYGYVTAGKQHGSTQNQIEESYTSPENLIQGTKVNLCAIPKSGYKFDGWYTNSACTTKPATSLVSTANQTKQDITVTMPSTAVTLYAKFQLDTYAGASGKIRIYIKKTTTSTNKTITHAHIWGGYSSGNWESDDEKLDTDHGWTATTYNSNDCWYKEVTASSNTYVILIVKGSAQSAEGENITLSSGGIYYITWPGSNKQGGSATSISGETKPGTDVYPVVLNVTNPEDDYAGDGTQTYAPAYATASTTFTVNHKPDDDHKINLTKTGYTGTAGTNSTTLTMPSTYSSSNKVTVTYDELAYFPVTFSSGPNGKVEACTGTSWDSTKAIKSGTMVKEGTSVTFKATANTGYAFSKWTGSSTSTTATVSLQIDAAKDVKGWFTSNDIGTQTSADVYFAYSTDSNPNNWDSGTTTKVYIKNGRALGYINNPTSGTRYYFAATSTSDPKNKAEDGKGLYHYDDSSLVVHTDFYPLIDANQYDQQNTKKLYFGGTQWSNSHGRTVSKIIVDLGEWDSTGNYIKGDIYRVIPVWDTDVTNVDIYAKDGSYRGDSDYDYFPGIADTVLTGATNKVSVNNFEIGSATRGTTITVTTTIDETHKGDFYIRGFSFNGVTPALKTASDGVANGTGTAYSQEYTIPADFEYDYLEITPIYYYKTGKHGVTKDNLVQFYIENYDKALEATGWGHTLAVYPYYQSGGSWVEKKQNAFGGYPGQPVIYYGGRRFIEIPTEYNTFTYDSGSEKACTIKGVTLSNNYWDIVHREYCGAVTEHKQTYDYDDFVKIYRETTDNQEKNGKTGLADQITFQFKYRTQTNNFADSDVKSADKNTGSTAAGNTVHQPYSSFTTSEKDSKFGNGWEPLLDYLDRPVDLFGKQLTDEQKQLDPLLVVSDDYEVTYAGSYATTWTVYARESSSATTYTKIAEIAPSALIVTSKARLDSTTLYPVTADQGGLDPTTLQEFSSAYNTLLSYKERPVQITYERAIENNSTYEKYYNKSGVVTNGWISEKAVRNDGRWTYSYYNDDVHANILIQYKNDESASDWTTDAFKGDTNQGTVTGAKAYFTNTAPNKDGEYYTNKTETGTVVSDQNNFYEFEATPTSGYVFAGWWFSRDNIETNVNEDLTKLDGHSQMTSNATFIARYIKAPTGTLTVNHELDPSSVGTGRTWVAVKAINKSTSDETWLTGAKTAENHFTENSFTVSDTYVGYKKDYRFEITLMTVRGSAFDVFDRFTAANDTYSQTYFSSGEIPDGSDPNITYSNTFTVDVDDMFHINSKGFPEQTFDTLSYFSALEQRNIGYEINFNYTSKIGDNNYYGDQSYKVTGVFTKEEFGTYLVSDDSDFFKFKSSNVGTFLASKVPYEANIRGNLKWIFSGLNVDDSTIFIYDDSEQGMLDGKITANMTATQSENATKQLQFAFPYRVKKDGNTIDSQKTSGKVVEVGDGAPTDNGYRTTLSPVYVPYGSVYTLTEGGDDYVEAEPIIYSASDNNVAKYFKYWSVDTDPDEGGISHTVARCYNLGFNFSMYQNYIVTAVYGNTPSTREHEDSASITWAENGRNQWNDKRGTAKSTWTYGDRIFSDFMITFDRADKTLLKTADKKSVTTGMITERLDTILDANKGTAKEGRWEVQTETDYNSLYSSRDSSKAEITDYIQGREGGSTTVAYAGMKYDGTKFVLADADNYENSFINMSNLDNKNRIEFTKIVPNISHSDKSDTGRKNYVYRAYAYMIDWNLDESGNPESIKSIKISDPVYYTIYDIATIANGKCPDTYTVTS